MILENEQENWAMAVLGIVAEYNPFHNGHLYLLEKSRQQGDFSATIAVMSGNFLQRGEPALCDKWARAEMALNAGVDLLIELPFCFATRSAYYFARGAVQLLQRTGVVTHLAFGSESGQLSLLQKIAGILAHEPESYKAILKKGLSRGLSFPLARSLALQEFMGADKKELQEILPGPNNILGLEYLRVIEEEGIPLVPLTIPRQGSSFHSSDLSPFSSARAIRQALYQNLSWEKITSSVPPATEEILQREISLGRAAIGPDNLDQAIMVNLRLISTNYLKGIYEVSEGLEFRIKEAANSCGTLEELRQCIKSKRYSLTRINRTLLYTLFALSKNQIELYDQHGPQYLHILGFSAKGQKILQKIKIKSKLKIFSRGSEMKRACDENQGTALADMISLDSRATDVYSLLFPSPATRRGGRDFTTSPVILPPMVPGT
ncbi:MAG: nucleotidyltransferase [Syntrophomonas sp.]|uniref:nucleotidyltransferase n=1 Tax=Syntrophomonas sp. TaxID=2053627 RepID=UPI00260F62EC|nr:nucleotidyltransferase [Syntrophomonas sp.]MDD2510124.1 nucleotidyltransferase [Syntrophomonas sp.]MDD3878527.1 nucleotidyltransferase [Syntrophomonas sp.]MDD4626438.1 nucleotidyltransferase [Syntrophomonas sp.]